MTAYLLTNHLLNFVAPAAALAVLLLLWSRLSGRLFSRKAARKPLVQRWWAQLGVVFGAGLAVLVLGLLVFGRDGKMLAYAGLVLASATAHWVVWRGWKA
ncbi:MAG: hypothetical protein Q7T87_13260 [Polaromonas sp.]|nr:hypothetical protein [Polaromonas sp.]